MDAMQHITGLVRKAVQDYEMIAPATGFWWGSRAARTAWC